MLENSNAKSVPTDLALDLLPSARQRIPVTQLFGRCGDQRSGGHEDAVQLDAQGLTQHLATASEYPMEGKDSSCKLAEGSDDCAFSVFC